MSKIELETEAAALPSEQRLTGGVFLTLAGLAALGVLSTNIMLPSFSSISDALSVSTRELGLTLSAFFLIFALGQLVVGPLSDRFGRRWLVLGGLVLFLGGSLLCALAGDFATLVAGRMVQALGVCAAAVLSRAIARDLLEKDELARVLALMMVAVAAAPGFSPLLGGALDQVFGWRSTFLVVAGLGFVLALFYGLCTGETHPPHRRVSVSPLAITRAYLRLATDARFVRPAAAVGLVMGGLFGFFAASPAILMDGLHLSALQLGLFYAGTVFIVFAAGLLAPRLARQRGQVPTAVAGLTITTAGGALLLLAAAGDLMGLPSFTLAVVVFLFGMGLATPLCTAIALSPFGGQAGLASALLGFLQMVGAALGATLATSLAFSPALALGLVQALAGALALALFLGPRRGF